MGKASRRASTRSASVQDLFDAHAWQDTSAIAIEARGERLAYDQLAARSDRLAHHLSGIGVGAESRVGVLLERSPDMVVAVLAVLKAGAAYVPLDPKWPWARLCYILHDSGAGALLSHQRTVDSLGSEPTCPIIALDALPEPDPGLRTNPPAVEIHPEQLAYVIYTSGSTGNPKGVEVPHRSLRNHTRSAARAYRIERGDRVLQFAPLSFDTSVEEIFPTLAAGATLVLRDDELSIEHFLRQLRERRITVLNLPTGYFHELVAGLGRGAEELPASVRLVIVGGETLRPDRLREWSRLVATDRHQARLVNTYGPTEATVVTTRWTAPGGLAAAGEVVPIGAAGEVVPIGAAIDGVCTRVLDETMQPCRPGAVGELYVGGAGVARGYSRRPALTAASFVPDPLAPSDRATPGGRLYKTGDRVRCRPDGDLEFLGRLDDQIKIRGFRVELGEVRCALESHPEVDEAAVVARVQAPGGLGLAAYVTSPASRHKPAARHEQWKGAHVDASRAVYEDAYRNIRAATSPDLNTVAWNSSYTDRPIPQSEMREWVRDTVDRIATLRPRRALEIGCGTGMLLLRLAERCVSYLGTDFSPTVLEWLSEQVRGLPNVMLACQEAADLAIGPESSFDTIVVNSVTQHFPGPGYLLSVIDGALDVTEAGGSIFIGDVRSLPLLEAFAASVALHRAAPDCSLRTLRDQVQRRMLGEQELVVDPRFFAALAQRRKRITEVHLWPKAGRTDNELNRFRYDVVLGVESDPAPPPNEVIDWRDIGDISDLVAHLRLHQPTGLVLTGVPNARVDGDLAILDGLAEGADGCVAELRQRLAQRGGDGVDPAEIRDAARQCGYDARPSWIRGDRRGAFDVALVPARREPDESSPLVPAQDSHPPLATLTNDPLRPRSAGELVPRLKRYLLERLPEHMVPPTIVLLGEMPRSSSGKVEHADLPAPDGVRPALDTELVGARSPGEKALAEIWREVLGLDAIGIHDNFFDLGGHSLTATRVAARLRSDMDCDVSLGELFDRPTVAELARYVDRLRRRGGFAHDAPPVGRADRSEPLPLSFSQQRLWFLDQIDGDDPAHNVPATIHLVGALDRRALQRALVEIVAHNEVLRTRFPTREGRPCQCIDPAADPQFRYVDVSRLPEYKRSDAARQSLEAEARRPFDLARGPLFRSTLVRLGDARHTLQLTAHHIITDGSSLALMFGVLGDYYALQSEGRAPARLERRLQYADFAAWQRSWLTGEALTRQLDYWAAQLESLPHLELPILRTSGAPRPPHGGCHRFEVVAGTTHRLREIGRRSDCTLSMTLTAAFMALLQRYTGQEDFAIGAPVSNRDRRELEDLLGNFVNLLVLRADLRADPTFEELLGRVRSTTLAAFDHRDAPFESVVERLHPKRDGSHNPLFQVSFALQDPPPLTRDSGRLSMRLEPFEAPGVRVELEGHMWPRRDALDGVFIYDRNLTDATTIAALADHFARLLEALARRPNRPLSTIDPVSEHEGRWIALQASGHAAAEPPPPVHRSVEEQARRHATTIAVTDGRRRVSFAQLNRRANRLARLLLERGSESSGRGAASGLVGLFLEPSTDWVVAMLAVAKSGAAYVPLDPALPRERLAAIAEDAAFDALVVNAPLPEQLVGALPAPIIDLVENADAIAAMPGHNLDVEPPAESHAYVLFTSGSTGRPKGVVVPHGALANHMRWMQKAFPLQAEDRVLQRTPPGFDASIWEFWAPLIAGARLVVAGPEWRRDPASLVGALGELGITVLQVVPTLLEILLDQTGFGACSELRTVFCGGEPLNATLARHYSASGPPARLVNLYGPTETTIDASFFAVEHQLAHGSVPIGRAIDGVFLYVLGGDMRLAPVGATGELYVGGAGVGLGYLGQPRSTAENFVPDPFHADAGHRMYRTRDLVRRRADGNIEFVGRADNQIKVRGLRIEPGEIEALLQTRPEVRRAVVVARQDRPADKRLVGYVVAAAETIPSTAELADFLKARLPGYMVPTALVTLDALPLLPSGKVDRRALPAPGHGSRSARTEYTPPRTEPERILCEIWQHCLDVEKVGVHDDFFDLGGHSLLATQVISRASEAFARQIPLRLLFAEPTVAALAVGIGRSERSRRNVRIEPAERAAEPPLSFAQQRLWFLDRLEPGDTLYNVPDPIRLRGRLDRDALEHALRTIIGRHESLRTTFPSRDGVPYQAIGTAPDIDLRPIECATLADPEGEATRRIQEAANEPFDLARGPLFRARLLRLAADHHVLLLNLHHIITDGWSQRLLRDEIEALYDAFVGGGHVSLPELGIQYADFSAWQRRTMRGPEAKAQLDYWLGQLRGAPPLLELPTYQPRSHVQRHRAGDHRAALDVALAERLRELGRTNSATLFMTMLAGFAVVLARHSGQQDIVVGSPIANRTHRDIENLIGFFVNTLALRTDLSGNPGFADLLARVRETTLSAFTNQTVPFERIVEALQPARDLSHAPVFQAMLVFQGAALGERRFADLALSELEAETTQSKFDLTLYVDEGDRSIDLHLVYDRDLFTPRQMRRLLAHLENVLRAAVEDADCRIGEIELADQRERREHARLAAAARPQNAFEEFARADIEQSIGARFDSIARRDPQAPALLCNGEIVRYEKLRVDAGRVAAALRGRLAGGEDARVALLFDKDATMVAGLIGTLMSGAAYVPLDPSYPEGYLARWIARTGVRLILSASPHLSLARSVAGSGVDVIDTEEVIAAHRRTDGMATVSPDAAAYVLGTSGSTGQPKGVVQSHRNVLHHVRGYSNNLHLRRQDRVTLLSSYSTDAGVLILLGALLNGASVFPIDLRREGVAELPRAVSEGRVTIFHSTPTLFRAFAELAEERTFPDVRILVLGGEEVVRKDVELYRRVFGPDCVLVNEYGLTESSLALRFFMRPHTELSGPTVPLGDPMPDTGVALLDEAGNVTPFCGEIAIASEHHALAYLGQPELTRKAFVPIEGDDSRFLYKSGDLGFRRPDGGFVFAGRRDRQTKVRGFRVEPGEIEAALRDHDGVEDSVVVTRPDDEGERRLVAYVVADRLAACAGRGAERLATELRGFLDRRLPAHMVPTAFIPLDAIPRTPSGKVDRQRLPLPNFRARSAAAAYVAPRNANEELLAAIWTECLGVEEVGAFDDFFELGGHSLLATQVLSRIREAFRTELPLRVLFQCSTLAALAAAVQRGHDVSPLPTIEPVDRGVELPLSFAQQRLWFLDRIEPGSLAYNILEAVRLTGPLDIDALRRAIEAVVSRHEVLRTKFPARDGTACQEIADGAGSGFDLIDLSEHPPEQREDDVRRVLHGLIATPFDLAAAPPWRAALLRTGGGEHVLAFAFHHILVDGWSLEVLREELGTAYRAFVGGETPMLKALPVQYADFASRQRQWLHGATLDRRMRYWRGQLRDLPVLQLPTDRPRPDVQSYAGASRSFLIPAALAGRLRTLARGQGATLFMAVLTSFFSLLQRYAGQSDFAIGTPIANRNRREVEDLIGFFVNMLVLRVDLRGNPSFKELLERVRAVTLDAYAHQDLPFEKLVDELQQRRDTSRNALFQASCTLREGPGYGSRPGHLELGDIEVEPVDLELGHCLFDLELVLWPDGRALQGCFVYPPELFEPATIARLTASFVRLLQCVVEEPEKGLLEIDLLSAAERDLLAPVEATPTVDAATRGGAATPANTAMPEDDDGTSPLAAWVAAAARRQPGSTAIESAGEHLEYRSLERRVNRLAHHLVDCGVGAETRVGVLLPRCPDLVVAVLAVLSAGGTYVPLDPTYPAARLGFLLNDAEIEVVLSAQRWVAKLPSTTTLPVLVDADAGLIAGYCGEPPDIDIHPEQLAYVIYTSGSTGVPKGVGVPHRALANHTRNAVAAFELSAADRVLQFAPLSFDTSAEEIFPTLAAGATLLLRDDELSIGRFVRRLDERRITVLNLPTGYWHELVRDLEQRGKALPASLRLVIVGGEAMRLDRLGAWNEIVARSAHEVRLVNAYGPTEATIGPTMWIPGALAEGIDSAAVPIGRPLRRVRALVLDEAMRPCPAGAVGELYLGGAALARGYQNRPGLTAASFVPDPFAPRSSTAPGDRLYKTGDRVRCRPDGNLEFLGRFDDQVKIRGFRIELDEVRIVLERHPDVDEAAVVGRRAASEHLELAAYVVTRVDAAVSADGLRSFVRRNLPDHMVPASFTLLDKFPRTSAGKVDPSALPPPAEAVVTPPRLTPRTPTEELLAGIWCHCIGVEGVGVDDNFFELGGHSLLATRVVSRIAAVFGVDLPIMALFDGPTIAQLASTIDRRSAVAPDQMIDSIDRRPQRPDAPLSFSQQRLWAVDRLTPARSLYHVSEAVRLTGLLDVASLRGALERLVHRHEALRTVFPRSNGTARQVVTAAGAVDFELIDLRTTPTPDREATVARLLGRVAAQPFDLTAAPPLRIRLLRLGRRESIVLIVIHHLITDGWSMGVLLQELGHHYSRLSDGHSSALAAMPIQYPDFAAWQRSARRAQVFEQQAAYWCRQLEGLPTLRLPYAKPPETVRHYHGAEHAFRISANDLRRVDALCRASDCTLFMAVGAALAVGMFGYSGQDDFGIGFPIANRNTKALEQLIGNFVNVLVLRADLRGNPRFIELLARTRRSALDGYTHQDLPFETLLDRLAENSETPNPLFQAYVNMQPAAPPGLHLPGVSVEPVAVPGDAERFDLGPARRADVRARPLRFYLSLDGDLEGVLVYNRNLFAAETIAQMVDRFRATLVLAADHPQLRIDELWRRAVRDAGRESR